MDAELDHSFPRYNPNPEDMEMLNAMKEAVKEYGADVALGFDGDGDRCGVVDDEGEEIFADKIGVLIARDLSALHKDAQFVVDVKSTGLFMTDPDIARQWRERPNIGKPVILISSARVMKWAPSLALKNPATSFSTNRSAAVTMTDLSPRLRCCRCLTVSQTKNFPICARVCRSLTNRRPCRPIAPTKKKYGVVDKIVKTIVERANSGGEIIGQKIRDVVTVNGVRITAEDGTWGLVRASSNKPELVVVVESPTSQENMKAMFGELDAVLKTHPEIGEYNQKI